jgi:hypothetical protein
MLSFSFVPAWSAKEDIMRFKLTANFDGRLRQGVKPPVRKRETWCERIARKLSNSSILAARNNAEDEKRFFVVGDSVMWDGHVADGAIGTVESTSVYPEQDADEFGEFVAFIKIDPNCAALLKALSEAVQQKSDEKNILIVQKKSDGQSGIDKHDCRCQLLDAPQSHAHMPIFGFRLGRWALVRQISACFQLFVLSFFPAVDTITDLVYILSQDFFNHYLFAASVLCITSQFWVFVIRLKKRRVFEEFKKRTVELSNLKTLWWWPKWASPDSLPVFFFMIVPFYIAYYVVFPVVWFFVGYIIYSFQLFPISRISNAWLYMFVYSFENENDPNHSHSRRFDTCDAIILPMVQKGKVEETVLESVPQLVIQLVNGYLLGEIAKMQVFAIFSISLSVLSLLNTVWYYSYWNLFRCKPIRDVPSSLSLYNYKLSGVKEGPLSFGKPARSPEKKTEIEMNERGGLCGITIDNSLNGSSSAAANNPNTAHAVGGSEIDVARPPRDNQDAEADKLRKAEEEIEALRQQLQNVEANKPQKAEEEIEALRRQLQEVEANKLQKAEEEIEALRQQLQDVEANKLRKAGEIKDMRQAMKYLEADKLRRDEENKAMKQVLQNLEADKLQNAEEIKAMKQAMNDLAAANLRMAEELQRLSAAAASAATGGVSDHDGRPVDTMLL